VLGRNPPNTAFLVWQARQLHTTKQKSCRAPAKATFSSGVDCCHYSPPQKFPRSSSLLHLNTILRSSPIILTDCSLRHSIASPFNQQSWSRLVCSSLGLVKLACSCCTAVLGASGGIGQVSSTNPFYSRSKKLTMLLAATVPPPQGMPKCRRALTLRCGQHPRCHR
jgi:hypothetical protein